MEAVMSAMEFLINKWAYLLFLAPLFTDWLERGRWPASLRELITEVVVGAIIIVIVNLLYRNIRQLKLHAETDGLTGLYNRRKFAIDLEREVARARRLGTSLSLVYIDIDKFKLINDKFGHNGGDFVLTEVANLLKKSGRKYVDLFYRLGGDEFAVILPGADESEAHNVVQRKLHAQQKSHHHLQRMGVSLSFGVADLRSHEQSQELLERADTAMYQFKQSGQHVPFNGDSRWPLNNVAHY